MITALAHGRRGGGGVVEVGQASAGEAAAELPLDAGQEPVLLGRDEHQGVARVAGPAGATDAVDVLLRGDRHVEVDDVGDVPHV